MQTEIVMQWKIYEMKNMSPKQSTGMKLCGQTKKTVKSSTISVYD
jgi:hypothetical protein